MKSLSQISSQEIIDFLKTVDKKVWIKSGVAAACGIFLLIFVAGPAWIERPQIRTQIRTLEGQILLTKTLFLKKPQLLKTKESYSKLIAKAKSRLYEAGESSLLLGALAQLATQSNVSVVASAPKDSASKFPSPYDVAYEGDWYGFTVEGHYHDLGTLTGKIESNAKQLRVEKFTLKSRPETPGIPLAEIHLSAVSKKKEKLPL